MSLAQVLDGFEFARTGGRLHGRCEAADLPRVLDRLADGRAEFQYVLSGVRNEYGRPALQVCVTGTVHLECSRCLEPVEHEVRSESTLVLVNEEDTGADEAVLDAGDDTVVASREMPLSTLIEDEVLLALPYAAHHAQCPRQSVAVATRPSSKLGALRELMSAKDGRNS